MISTFALITLILFLPASVIAQSHTVYSGVYSHVAISIWGSNNGLFIHSSDGRKTIIAGPPPTTDSGANHTVTVRAYGHEYSTAIGAWVNAEVAWSPDSKAFFVTYSDGGNVGTYHVKVFYVTKSGLRIIEPIANGRTLFAPICFDLERPNVGAIKWMGNDSSRLLIAVQVPPHSSCASMGTFRAFEIALPSGKILAHYNQINAKKLFRSDLGSDLWSGDDSCIYKPQSCVPRSLNINHKRNQSN